MTDLIKYGMGREYLLDWGFPEALREIYQNFRDYGKFKEVVTSDIHGSDGLYSVMMTNSFAPEGNDFMKIGVSGKRGIGSAVGKHGEGLKMAAMVLKRSGCEVCIQYRDVQLDGVFYEDPFLGECFGFEVSELVPAANVEGFLLSFQIPVGEWRTYDESLLTPEDVIHSSYHGDLLDKPKGEVYVGGHFVSVVEGLEYAYNFKPEFVELDRDRKVPRDFDVIYNASQILQNWKNLQLKDVVSKDAAYMGSVPHRIAKKFKPSMVGDKVVFRAGAVQAPQKIADRLMSMPLNQKRVARMKYSVSRKRTPNSVVKEFLDRYHHLFSSEGRADAQVLLKKSKGWKQA